MKKSLFITAVLIGMFSVATLGFSLESSVPFSGTGSQSANNSPAAKFYLPLTSEIDVIGGISLTIPGSEAKETNLDLLLGLRTSVPVLKIVDVYGIWNDEDGTSTDKRLTFESLNVSKKWTTELTPKVSIGIEAVLGQLTLNGSSEATLLPSLHPVITMNLEL